MAIFDDVVSLVDQRFGLHEKARSLISLLLSLVTDPKTGGLGGFLERLKKGGLDSVATRIVGGHDTTPLTADQVEKALGGEHALQSLASKVGLSESAVASAAGFLLPRIIGTLTPGGKVSEQLSGDVQEFIRHNALAKVEVESKHEPVVGVTRTTRETYEAPRREAETPRRETYEAPRRESYEAPRRENYEGARHETYEVPRREVIQEAPRREVVREAPRRTVEPIRDREDSSWFWWALPLIGLALLGAYAAKGCTPVKEPRVYTPAPIPRREARPVRPEPAPEPAPAPVERRETYVAPAPVERRETYVPPAPVERRETYVAPAPVERRETYVPPAPVEHREAVAVPAPVQTTVAPRLVIGRLDDGRVRVSGVVVDDATRRAILTSLETAFGSGKVVSELAVDARAGTANWAARLLDIAKLVAANPAADITLEGNKVSLGGRISDTARRTLIDAIKTYLGTNFTIE